MTYEEAMEYMEKASWRGSKPGLTRVKELLHKLGDPQDKLRFVHVAGTNGKGSTAAMLASILRAAGYRTGLFTSPYIKDFNERLQLDGLPIENEALASIISRIKPVAEKLQDPCTEFEIITAAAMLWFAEDGSDIVVLEVGLGGRLDATNIISTAECDVITNIGMDHMAVLGDTVEQIAFEKSGIMKGCPVVSYKQQPEVAAIIRQSAKACGAKLITADFNKLTCVYNATDGQKFHYGIGPEYELPLLGENQRNNAAVALEAVEVLRSRGFTISDDAINYGFRSVKWSGRFELVCHRPLVVVDGAHNPQAAKTVAANLNTYFPSEWRVMLIGVLADKDWMSMLETLAPTANAFVAVPPASHRALPPRELCLALEKFGKHAIARDNVEAGIDTSINLAGAKGMVCAAGSLYLAGAVRKYFGVE